MSTSAQKRRDIDVAKLMMSDYDVTPHKDGKFEFYVKFKGPTETAYEGGVWAVHVSLPPDYPFKSPSIGFMNRMLHPNVDERSGSVCLDVINQTWSPMYDLVNVFDTFLPQLLRYPNPTDPLNPEAAALLINQPDKFKKRIQDYVKSYATDESAGKAIDSAVNKKAVSPAKPVAPAPPPSVTPAAPPAGLLGGGGGGGSQGDNNGDVSMTPRSGKAGAEDEHDDNDSVLSDLSELSDV